MKVEPLLTLFEEVKTCTRCNLGGQNNWALPRGNPSSRRMIIGEAAGKYEARQHTTFVGPAGQLWDKILASVGWSDEDWFITNIILCRPVAPRGSGKENFAPKVDQIGKCRSYLEEQIRLVNPKVIITLGRPATEAILGVKGIRMGDYRGKLIQLDLIQVFPMFHPSYLLRSQGNIPKYEHIKELVWEDIQKLKETVERKNL